MLTFAHDGGPTTAKSTLPLPSLLALFTAGFLAILNETVPAGLLPKMAASLGLPASVTGQTITVYALATALTAIPLNAALKNIGRRTLLVWALGVFAAANLVIAFQNNFTIILIARFPAGVAAGLIWSNIGGIAARLVPEKARGKAIAIALAGTPAALSLGLPAGTVLGDATSWHATFGMITALSLALIGWVLASVPNLAAEPPSAHMSFPSILRAPGVQTILWVIAGFITAHNLLYTYIEPLASRAGAGQIEWVLLVFGIAALLSIWVTGQFVDPHHRRLMLVSSCLLGASAAVLGLAFVSPAIFYLGVAAWGLGFGGSATLFVTAGIRAAGTDGVTALVVTVFNLSIAAGGMFGALLLTGFGVLSIPWASAAIMIPTILTVVAGRQHAFPQGTRTHPTAPVVPEVAR
ncbi:putative MFS family arabinose efflux permease [Nakamurella sp. UYEF19]|uniref:MFS transporter n=1 Tax=Nakamurella sp. UYEF19 TaxID=1756392 RepID=UPI003390CBA1